MKKQLGGLTIRQLFKFGTAILLLASQASYAFNPAHLKQLQETCSCEGCDLSGANLANFKLGDNNTLNPSKAKVDSNGLIICSLTHANFSHTNLKNAYFSPSDFAPGIYSKVGKIVLNHCNFDGANLRGAHFNAVEANEAKFQNSNMSQVRILKGASFKNCNFNNAQMDQLEVAAPMGGCGATLTGSSFNRANVSNSQINADFSQVSFIDTNLYNARLTPCDEDPKTSFRGTRFLNVNWLRGRVGNQPITEALLPQAKFCKALLTSGISNRDCGK
jgi:uncharacterized protein YjbI with pentapeptide repeats